MNNLCRLCLTVSKNISHTFCENDELLNKIGSSLSIKISLEEALPDKLCNICIKKIEETHTFCQQVKENQSKLNNLLSLGKSFLYNFYNRIYDEIEIKLENIEDSKIYKYEYHFSSDDEVALERLKTQNGEVLSTNSNTSTIKEQVIHKNDDSQVNYDGHDNNDRIKLKSKDVKENKEEIKNIEDITIENTDINNLNIPVLQLKEECLITQFECLTCFEKFENQNVLIKHYMKEHSSKEDENNGKKEKEYVIKFNENGTKIFICHICDKMYEKRKDILRHLYCHKDNRPFVCKMCGRTYKTVYEIVRHGRVHNGQKLYCSFQCGFSTVYGGALRDHEKRHSKTNNKYICKKCGKGFQVRTWYEQHQNIHSGEKPFVCDICGVAFHMHRYLTSHMAKVHLQSSDSKRYSCVQCSTPCDSRNSLNKHMEVHGVKISFLCDLCGKVFRNADQLKYHNNTHLGVKPFACGMCEKVFSRKFHLKVHEQTHTGERKHGCMKCSKHFTQRSTLLRHVRRHHPEELIKLKRT